MRIFLALCLIILGALPASARAQTAPVADNTAPALVIPPGNPEPLGDYTQYYTRAQAPVMLDNTQTALTYFMFAPEKPWPEDAKFPLVLALHGAQGVAEAGRYLIGEKTRKAFPAFILVPALPAGKRWRDSGNLKPSHSLSAAVEVLNHVLAQQPAIDTSRIYVIGCGMGGNGAFAAAQYHPDIFAAAVAISGEWNDQETAGMKSVPLAAFHFTQDKVTAPYAAMDTVTAVKQAGGTAYFTTIEQDMPDCKSERIYNELLWKWLFAQHKG
ncbi:MAG TPA: prolyl oligopeptidase family serine peptidase [Micavibrio sp.]